MTASPMHSSWHAPPRSQQLVHGPSYEHPSMHLCTRKLFHCQRVCIGTLMPLKLLTDNCTLFCRLSELAQQDLAVLASSGEQRGAGSVAASAGLLGGLMLRILQSVRTLARLGLPRSPPSHAAASVEATVRACACCPGSLLQSVTLSTFRLLKTVCTGLPPTWPMLAPWAASRRYLSGSMLGLRMCHTALQVYGFDATRPSVLTWVKSRARCHDWVGWCTCRWA